MARRLGQHFLSDTNILDRIVDAIEPQPDDVVLEIGPGKGSLTARLAPRVARVIAIEKDRRLAEALRDEGGGRREGEWPSNLEIVSGDALEVDWHDLLARVALPPSPFPLPRFKVIGNIPYYITAPLIEKALTPPYPRCIVLLVQREVADRLVARPGNKDYGALTIGVQCVAQVERLFLVKAGAFSPPPKVDSAVVRLTPLARPLVGHQEQERFRTFVVALFSRRRKQLARSLRDVLDRPAGDVLSLLKSAGLDPSGRVEVFPPADLVRLFRLAIPDP